MGNGMAVFVYVPFLVLGVCLAASPSARRRTLSPSRAYDSVVAAIFFALFSARAEVMYDRSCRAPYRGFLMRGPGRTAI